jgi:hypothetical protein
MPLSTARQAPEPVAGRQGHFEGYSFECGVGSGTVQRIKREIEKLRTPSIEVARLRVSGLQNTYWLLKMRAEKQPCPPHQRMTETCYDRGAGTTPALGM